MGPSAFNPCRTRGHMQPSMEFTIYRKFGRPKHSCKACRARLVGQYYPENMPPRLQNGQRSRLRSAQLAQGVRPFRDLWWDMGYTPTFLMSYIEAGLPPAWNWENHGEVWQIDHIRPLSEADLSCPFELYRLAHYTNPQPLSTQKNIAKGRRPSLLSPIERQSREDGLLYPATHTERDSHVDQSGTGDPQLRIATKRAPLFKDGVRSRGTARGERPVGPRSGR